MVVEGSDAPTRYPRSISRRELATLAAALACVLVSPFASSPPPVAAKKKDKKNKSKRKNKNGKNGTNGNRNEKNKPKRGGSSKGQAIVEYAQKHKGAPYVWGGESPNGFDCSGFTWFVFNHAAGIDIGRTEDVQWRQGRSVSRGDWQPGDLVFFENTFERGLSHVGISMGGDDFIHAENESTGVVVSSLSSDYYSSHYAGARRIV